MKEVISVSKTAKKKAYEERKKKREREKLLGTHENLFQSTNNRVKELIFRASTITIQNQAKHTQDNETEGKK